MSENALRIVAFLVCAFMVLSAASMSVGGGSAYEDTVDGTPADYAPGELLVKFRDDAKNTDKHAAKAAVKGKGIKFYDRFGINHWKLDKDVSVDKAVKELGKKKYADIIEYAEPNWYAEVDTRPMEAYRGEQWNMHNVAQFGGVIDADIDMLEVWDNPPESSEVVVAVIDTGIDYTHPDLDGVVWTNPGETPDDEIDNDGNGFVDDYYGWDFHNGDNDPMDDNDHGSHCAGVIAAEHNGLGVAGMAQSNVKIMGLKWLNSGGGGQISNAIAAIDYAASFGVKITSNSWGGSIQKKVANSLETAIENSGALFVASAGNDGTSKKHLPAGFDLDNIISVAATTHRDNLVSWSNYGTSWVDIGAPGVNIMSCGKGDRYLWMSGTSMSCPHVAGAAAMLLSYDDTMTVAELKAAILDNAEPETTLDGKVGTGGKLNMLNIFGGTEIVDDGSDPEQISDLSYSATSMNSVTLTWTAVGGDQDSTTTNYIYDIRRMEGDITSFDWDTAEGMYHEPPPKAPGTTEVFEVTGLSGDTKYNFAILARDEGGRAGAPSSYVTATTDAPIWDMEELVDNGGSNIYYQSMALDDSGNAAFVYSYESATYFLYESGGTWYCETIESGRGTGGGVDITWDGSTWWVVMGGGACRVGERTGTDSWSITTVEARKVQSDWKTIESHGSIIGVSYRYTGKGGGIMYGEYDGSSWTTETVEAGAAARYSDLEYDSNGDPGIAYSDVIDDNWLRVLSYAHRSSGTWTVSTVLSGAQGYGVQVDLEYDSNDYPHMVCCGDALMYAYWDGSAWQSDAVDGFTYSSEPSLALVSDTPYVAYHGEYGIKVAKFDGTDWVNDAVESEYGGGFRICLEHYGTDLHLGYNFQGFLKYATRDISGTGPAWGGS